MTLEDFAKKLNIATKKDLNDMPVELYKVVAEFLNEKVFDLLIGAAIASAILFIFYGSFQYFTAYGDENKAGSAKKTITYAFIGLIIAFSAMGISALVQQTLVSNTVQNAVAPITVR